MRRYISTVTMVLALAACSPELLAQDPLQWEDDQQQYRIFKNLYVGGMYRMLGYHRTMSESYPEHSSTTQRISVGDGYRIPTLDLNVGGSPFPGSWFSSQIYFTPQYAGAGAETTGQVSLGLGLSISGGVQTPFGYANVDFGGLNWKRLSPLTLWANEGFNRFSIFDRSPWEQTGNAADRYNEFFQRGGIVQDTRWGRRAFQGIYAQITDMPKDMSAVLVYGKTDNNGGADSYNLSTAPNQAYAGRLQKGRQDYIAVNTFNTVGYTDSINGLTYGINLATAEIRHKLGPVALHVEAGAGSYHSPNYQQRWSEGITVTGQMTWKQTPIMLQVYRLGVNFVNPNSTFFNTSIAEANMSGFDLANSQSIQPFKSPLTAVGQLTNNRQGVNINAEHKFNSTAFSVGYANSMELERITSGLSFNHRINGLQFSRLSLFTRDLGPYQRVHTFWMGYYEEVPLTDTANGLPASDKFFNTVEAHAKQRFHLFGKDGFVYYLLNWQSAQNKFSAIPMLSDAAYLRVIDHELEMYYPLTGRMTLAGYAGLERAMGNNLTGLNTKNRNPTDVPTNLPLDQTGRAIGVGLDIDVAKDMGIHVRHRWYDFRDANFADDVYAGQETILELKFTF